MECLLELHPPAPTPALAAFAELPVRSLFGDWGSAIPTPSLILSLQTLGTALGFPLPRHPDLPGHPRADRLLGSDPAAPGFIR